MLVCTSLDCVECVLDISVMILQPVEFLNLLWVTVRCLLISRYYLFPIWCCFVGRRWKICKSTRSRESW